MKKGKVKSTQNRKADHIEHPIELSTAKKRRIRRKKAKSTQSIEIEEKTSVTLCETGDKVQKSSYHNETHSLIVSPELDLLCKIDTTENLLTADAKPGHKLKVDSNQAASSIIIDINMSSKEIPSKTKDEILAAREAKKLAKQNAKSKLNTNPETKVLKEIVQVHDTLPIPEKNDTPAKPSGISVTEESPKGKDEVDKAAITQPELSNEAGSKDKEQIKAERAAKKLAKQTKKKGLELSSDATNKEVTKESVIETLANIVKVAKEVQEVTAKVNALLLKVQTEKPEASGKSKADLKAERRAKQEAQRAAKQVQQTVSKPKVEIKSESKPAADVAKAKEKDKSPKLKAAEKPKAKSQMAHKMNWFQHLYIEKDEEALKKIALNSHLHPAIIKLGVQLSSRVVTGSNARCIALLDALKKMVTDYMLPAKTEFARGLESHLASSLEYLWSMRQPSASQTNAVKYFRYHLTQLPNTVNEFDAKKSLHEEIDRYIHEQIEMAGEAISIAVRNKISRGDNILTYGCSSLIERILCEATSAGVEYRATIVGNRVNSGAREMLRRLVAHGVNCTYVDITALQHVMYTVDKVLLGASSLLVNGSVLGTVGTAQTALAARSCNVPVLVCCETHKFSERVQTDAFVYNELGNPEDLIDSSDESSPLKDWRSNQNLSLLNLTYDVTPASLVTAVVTELAILPCTSAPVVLRFKLSEYGI